MKLIIANIKSQQNFPQAQTWINEFGKTFSASKEKQIIIAPSFTNLSIFQPLLKLPSVALAAQDVSPFPSGAYTGAINAGQLKSLNVAFCLVGHSERRRWFHESHQDIGNKIRELIDQNITPILCIDEPYLSDQLNSLDQNWFEKIIIAYEPLDAIGSGQPHDPAQANHTIAAIKKHFPEKISVVYGGSVTPQNVKRYTSQSQIDGVLIGGSSLIPHEFIELINQA